MVRSFFFSETEKDLRAYIPSCVGMHRRTYPSPAIKLTTRPQIWSMGGSVASAPVPVVRCRPAGGRYVDTWWKMAGLFDVSDT